MIHRSSSMWKGTKTLCKIRFVGTFQHTVSHCSKTGERDSGSSHEGLVPLLFARDSAPGAVAAAVLLLPLPALRAAACLLAAVAAAVLLLPVPALPGAACLVAAVAAAFGCTKPCSIHQQVLLPAALLRLLLPERDCTWERQEGMGWVRACAEGIRS